MAKKKVNSRKVIKKNSLNNSNKTFISIALIIFGIVSFISLYSTKMGIFGIFIYKIFSFLSGSGNFLFPILFIITGSSFLIKKELNLINRYNICLFIISICILIFLDGTKMSDITLIDRLRLSIEYLDIATSGGIIGSILGFLFYKIFGSVGTYLFLSIIILISLFFIFKSSFNNFEFNKFWNSFINNLKLKK